jgi:hypothetical protein
MLNKAVAVRRSGIECWNWGQRGGAWIVMSSAIENGHEPDGCELLIYVVINASRILPGGRTPAINPTRAGWRWLKTTLVGLDRLK